MTRCCICMGWFHLTCTDSEEDVKYARKNTICTCPACRAVPSTLSSLQADLSGLINLLHRLASDSSQSDASPRESEDGNDDDSRDNNHAHGSDYGESESEENNLVDSESEGIQIRDDKHVDSNNRPYSEICLASDSHSGAPPGPHQTKKPGSRRKPNVENRENTCSNRQLEAARETSNNDTLADSKLRLQGQMKPRRLIMLQVSRMLIVTA